MERAEHQGDASLEAYAVSMEQEYEGRPSCPLPFADAYTCEHCQRDTRSLAGSTKVCPNCAQRLCADCFSLTMHEPCNDMSTDGNDHDIQRRGCSSTEATLASDEPGYIRQPHSGTASDFKWAQYRQRQAACLAKWQRQTACGTQLIKSGVTIAVIPSTPASVYTLDGSGGAAPTVTLTCQGQRLPPHLSSLEPWLRELHEAVDRPKGQGSLPQKYKLPLTMDTTARQCLAALSDIGEANSALLLQVQKAAEDRAARRGVQRVSARDVRDAATSLLATKPLKQQCHPPLDAEQLTWLDGVLAEVKCQVDEMVKNGCPRPRVLLVGERTGTAARRWRQAGADVMTNDLEPSEDPSIPHAQVPAELIQDSGFDFVYSCPPCDYLSNASVSLLHKEEGRIEAMAEAVKTFLSMYHVRAPLSAAENSKMNPYATQLLGLSPSEIVRPFEHGHAEAKAICLYKVGNLPPLRPTFMVEGRDRRLANLAPGLTRGASRGRSFDGVMAAMASQWMGPVLAAARERRAAGDHRSCEDILASVPGLHASIPLDYTPPKGQAQAGRLTVSVLRGLTASQRGSIDVVAKTREAETWLRTALTQQSEVRAKTLASLEPSQGVRLREEDPPSYAVPDTRQFRCRRGIWYAWTPRKSLASVIDSAGELEDKSAEQKAEGKALFYWQRLDKASQDACCKIIHGIEHEWKPEMGFPVVDHCETKRREAKSGKVKRRHVPMAIPEQSTPLDFESGGTRVSSEIPEDSLGWPERLSEATRKLAELTCGSSTAEAPPSNKSNAATFARLPHTVTWTDVVDHESALGHLGSADASDVLRAHTDRWVLRLL